MMASSKGALQMPEAHTLEMESIIQNRKQGYSKTAFESAVEALVDRIYDRYDAATEFLAAIGTS
jgi:hypothetical protein